MVKSLGILFSTMTVALPSTFSCPGSEQQPPLSRNEKRSSSSENKKLPTSYQVCYGNPASPIQITEYFSLGCPQCIKTFRKDFQTIKNTYLKTGEVGFNFHLDPMDELSLQALVCLEKLSTDEKTFFWEALLHNFPYPSPSQGCVFMKKIMHVFGKPIPLLDQFEYIEKTTAFKEAQHYLEQKDVIRAFPTIEINSKIYDEMLNFSMLSREIGILLKQQRQISQSKSQSIPIHKETTETLSV